MIHKNKSTGQYYFMNTRSTLTQTLILMTALMAAARTGAQSVTAIATCEYTSYFLRSDGTVLAAGNNSYGQLGNGTNGYGYGYDINVLSAVLVSNITAISAGDAYALFLRKDGVMLGTGYNAYGQLGAGANRQQCHRHRGLRAGQLLH
jgi:alpha-tubulin suppressor-like RCC1 family protein